MEAVNNTTGEVKKITRERNGTAWCPFCDRSRMVATTGPICEGCLAEFRETVIEEEQVEVPARRRRATVEELEENTAEEAIADAVSEEAGAE